MTVLRNLPRRLLPASGTGSHLLRILLFFVPFFFLLALYARSIAPRDPGSTFFKPWTAYDAPYSSVRARQADAYMDLIDNGTYTAVPKASSQPELCVGIASIARKGVRYFRTTVGTVLEGLSENERAKIYLVLFIAHTNASEHPAYSERWFHEVPDQVLLYNPEEVDIEHIASLETEEAKLAAREKGLFDYRYLLKACGASNAPYTLMLEDDVVSMDGWYHRTRKALTSAEKQTESAGASKWLYLRLFYTEEFFGWNSEEWPTYLIYSILISLFIACVSLSIRQYKPQLASSLLSNATILFLSFFCAPILIGLFFATGRVTMFPIPNGVHQMPWFGCCSQALVFPQSRISELVDFYEHKRLGFPDSLTEEFAIENQEIRWAVTPAVMQHAGRISSKGNHSSTNTPARHKSKAELKDAEKIWNFNFETLDSESLRKEHDLATQYDMN